MNMWILFTALHLVSLIFGVVSVMRLYAYIGRYRFDESKYTLLFGFIHLRWIAVLYLGAVILWIPASLLFFL